MSFVLVFGEQSQQMCTQANKQTLVGKAQKRDETLERGEERCSVRLGSMQEKKINLDTH